MTGLRTKTGRKLHLQKLHEILRNPVYLGRIESSKWAVSEPGDFEPIVDGALFAAARAALRSRATGKVDHDLENPDFPLRRFVRCSGCSGPLTGSGSRSRSARYGYYHCPRCGAGPR